MNAVLKIPREFLFLAEETSGDFGSWGHITSKRVDHFRKLTKVILLSLGRFSSTLSSALCRSINTDIHSFRFVYIRIHPGYLQILRINNHEILNGRYIPILCHVQIILYFGKKMDQLQDIEGRIQIVFVSQVA